jgi:hypothetical protein
MQRQLFRLHGLAQVPFQGLALVGSLIEGHGVELVVEFAQALGVVQGDVGVLDQGSLSWSSESLLQCLLRQLTGRYLCDPAFSQRTSSRMPT